MPVFLYKEVLFFFDMERDRDSYLSLLSPHHVFAINCRFLFFSSKPNRKTKVQ